MDSCSSPWNGEGVDTPKTSQYFPDDSGYLSNPGSSGSESKYRRLRESSYSSPEHWRSPVNYCYNRTPIAAFQQNCSGNGQFDELPKAGGTPNDSVLLNDSGCCEETVCLRKKLLAASCRENLSRLTGSATHTFFKSSQYSTQSSPKTIAIQTAPGLSESQTPDVIDVNPCRQSFSKCIFTHRDSENKSLGLYESSIIIESSVPCSWSSKVGKPRVDVLAALASYRPVVSRILQFLGPEDLVTVATVSRTWRNICKNDKQANRRRQMYLRAKIQLKENIEVCSPYLKAQQHSRRYLRRGACSELQNLCLPSPRKKEPVSPPVSPSKVRFHLFYKEGGKLSEGEHLMPCPRCSLPSHISSSEGYGRCSRPGCLFEFCIHCHCAPHAGKPCRAVLPVLQSQCRRTRNGIGSAASRRNLRKLLL